MSDRVKDVLERAATAAVIGAAAAWSQGVRDWKLLAAAAIGAAISVAKNGLARPAARRVRRKVAG